MSLHNALQYVTDVEARRIYNERRKYKRGTVPPRHPVPAVIYHVYLPVPDDNIEGGRCGSIWEYSRFSCEPYEPTLNKRVKVLIPTT